MKILGLACEPWQTKMVINTLSALDEQCEIDPHIGILDFYQYVHNVQYKNYTEYSAMQITFHNQDSLYTGWQDRYEDHSILDDFDLSKWEDENCTKRSLKEIASGNALTNQWERTSYWLPVNKYWEDRVLVDTIKWCEELIADVDPSIVFNIERAELAQSIIDLICQRKKIPMLTFIPSRIDSRWLSRDDFGYGTGIQTQHKIRESANCVNCREKANLYILNFRSKPSEGYSSMAGLERQIFTSSRSKIRHRIVQDAINLSKDIYFRHFLVPKEMKIKPVRFEENHLRFTGVKIRKLLIHYVRIMGISLWGHKKVTNEPFILWALHGRPETSVLVLGDGKDEIEQIRMTAKKLPPGYKLVVKENPVMFGLRGHSFYRGIRKIPNVYLLDAFVDTYKTIKKATGVVGISGTILLEAAFLGKPICILGMPEFISNFRYRGENGLIQYMADLQNDRLIVEFEVAKAYLTYVFHNSRDIDVKYFTDPDLKEAIAMTRAWADIIENQLRKHNLNSYD